MSLRAHLNQSRILIALAPGIAAGMMIFGALGGEREILVWQGAYLALAPLAFLGWWGARGLGNVLNGTPLSKIGTARPGYVAILGTATALAGRQPLVSPSSGTPCVWFHYRQGRTTGVRTGRVAMVDSEQPFLLADETGECLVDPSGAEITGVHEDRSSGNYERLILPGDRLFVIGQLRPPLGPAHPSKDKTRPVVRREFDHEPDARELEEMERSVEKERGEAGGQKGNPPPLPALQVIAIPEDSRPYLIGMGSIGQEGGWYAFLSYFNLGVAAVAIVALACLHLAGR